MELFEVLYYTPVPSFENISSIAPLNYQANFMRKKIFITFLMFIIRAMS